MANYLDQTGLQSVLTKLKSWAEGKFLTDHQDISGKVDKISGKGLSTNDFTTTLKNKLDGIASGAEVNVNADWNATSGDAQILNKPTIPTNTNQLANGAGYQTASEVSTAINNAIGGITSFSYEVVTTLPATGVNGKIYLKAHSHGTGDAYDEYIWTGSAFEKIGNTDVDLSNYVTKTTLEALDFSDPSVEYTASTSFISSISQTDGQISATKKTLPTGTANVAGITKVGASGGAAAYSHTHDYTNDSALNATQIATAFTNAGYPT